MLAKIWKKVCIAVLIVACLFNIISKLVNRISFKTEIQSSAQYVADEENTVNDNANTSK